MGIDTVTLRSPEIQEQLAERLERLSVLRMALQDGGEGEVLWRFTTGDLDGSFDSRISFRVMREDWILNKAGRPQLQDCEPWLKIEASLPKVFFGQNIYGVLENFRYQVMRFLEAIEILFGLEDGELPSVEFWQVMRVDWSEMFWISFLGIRDFFRQFERANFPRRRFARYGLIGIHFPGTTTTLKFYHKGPEFKDHDVSRLRQALTEMYRVKGGQGRCDGTGLTIEEVKRKVEKKLKALQRLADSRLRVECQINGRKLQEDFADQIAVAEEKMVERGLRAWEKVGRRYPLVNEITDEYLQNIYHKEVEKVIREGKSEMDTVRDLDNVRGRLVEVHGAKRARNLIAFWQNMSTQGEVVVRGLYSESQFYNLRRQLQDAGVSWFNTNIYVLNAKSQLPRDFRPLRGDARICVLPIRLGSALNLSPMEFNEIKQARKAA